MNLLQIQKIAIPTKIVLEQTDSWTIQMSGVNIHTEREFETISAMGNGYLGTRNSLEEYSSRISTPASFVAGFYETPIGDDMHQLVNLPDWTRVEIFIDGEPVDIFSIGNILHVRSINLRKGICSREWQCVDDMGRITNIKIIKFVSIADKNLSFKSVTIKPENYSASIRVRTSIDGKINGNIVNSEIKQSKDNITFIAKADDSQEQVAMSQKSVFNLLSEDIGSMCAEFSSINYDCKVNDVEISEEWEWLGKIGRTYNITSLVSTYSSIDYEAPIQMSESYFEGKNHLNYLEVLGIHTEEWSNIWKKCFIEINGCDNAQKWINFAIYHLVIAAKFSGGKYSIPARTLTGQSYKGHIFWDTEIYLLPFYTLNFPDISKALLMYRYNTLEGARENARNEGYSGASYAWESTDTGREETPTEVLLPNGEVVKIYSGIYENHISSDIAYAIWQYWIVTCDDDFLFDYGAEIIFETARFCASLLKKGDDGKYHIFKAVGPDEYHELVDDNNYTNIMVAYNLELCEKLIKLFKEKAPDRLNCLAKKISLFEDEISAWEVIRKNIYIGYDEVSGVFEQFSGYFDLEDINVYDYEPRSTAMDIILGREKTNNSKVIKQPDVLMYLFLLKNRFSLDTIKRNYMYYEPKTGHGSSLSPSIHSIIASWIGENEDSYRFFEQNTQIDLGNKMGNAAGGIHIASQGGTWMAVVMGFAGINITEKGLVISPNLPEKWDRLSFSLLWRSQKLEFSIYPTHFWLKNCGDTPVFASAGDDNWIEISPIIRYKAYFDDRWIWQKH